MRIVLGRHARAEAHLARTYYGHISAQLGRQFADRLDEALVRVAASPLAWPPLAGGLRRCLLTQFPHSVIYRVLDDHVRVVAIAHQSRRPGYWQDR